MRADANLSSQNPVQIAANVKVLVCREMCIPGKAQVSLTLPVKLQPPPASAQSTQFFTEARKAWPRPAPASWKFSIAQTNDSFVLTANLGHKITGRDFLSSGRVAGIKRRSANARNHRHGFHSHTAEVRPASQTDRTLEGSARPFRRAGLLDRRANRRACGNKPTRFKVNALPIAPESLSAQYNLWRRTHGNEALNS